MKTQQGSELFSAIIHVPFGALGIRTAGALVTELFYLPASYAEKAPQDALAERAARQVLAYCADPDSPFDLPLAQLGSEFQRRVWDTIRGIPRGQVRTYGELARHLGSAARAVGQACGANYFPLVIPCHRVTGANGLGGFAGDDNQQGFTLGVKRWLLAHEGHSEYAWQQTTLL
ncbi:methylated-DNA--[protein]-cysteine S-methyltransferase [Pseudoduganella violacea]|uniref:Methylated-DNA-[protein]-cysteine S-methyltransferase n=1 Tax=Pseudoduganella violacea TaxID=1715466 RepID=A0A7W5BC44_9BURK|nr:methylated-DNA--[protein]-cysteine S-methyltransferase [Pseudoduganella violacea]MBB3120452.1 methylated-DNA-[protein]-cysteine S-methyltransferase [Pseudoduganella violacea]